MLRENTSVLGLYPAVSAADTAVERLLQAGFANDSISVLLPDSPQGTAAGGVAGAMVGTTLGVLAGLCTLAIPGMGLLIVAGPILGAIAGLGLGTAAGSVETALMNLGVPAHEANRYEGRIKGGSVLVSAHCDTEEQLYIAKGILEHTGADAITATRDASFSATASRT